MFVRSYAPGMGQAVADRTVNRPGENWGDVAKRVAQGSHNLHPATGDRDALQRHISQASILLSGRHLQHGDKDQPKRDGAVFTNCLDYKTKLPTLEHGVVEIGSLAGQTVTVRAADGQWRSAEVSEHGRQKLYRLTFGNPNKNGIQQEVIATKNHRWFLDDGSITDNIEVGDALLAAPLHQDFDEDAVRHGIVFGDGTAPKSRKVRPDCAVSQGRDYVSIRLCDAKRDYLPLFEGYGVTYPPSAKGDPVVYVGKKAFWKQLPFSRDPSYIAGFIHGWWMADGSKAIRGNVIEISTTDLEAVEWLYEHAAYVGYIVTMHRTYERKPGDGSFGNGTGKTLYWVRLRKERSLTLLNVEELDEQNVYCLEEPVTSGFVLANGLLTGNCSTAITRAPTFRMLLCGSGVGTCYDDALQVIDWSQMPIVVPIIEDDHADVKSGRIVGYMDQRAATHFYSDHCLSVFVVPDTREGWAAAIEQIEIMAFKERRDEVLLLDFSQVRGFGSPIKGMQNRPASGPGPLMDAISRVAKIRETNMPKWKQAMMADHLFAEVVLSGGARRSARIAVKYWKDEDILDYIEIKRPTEYWDKSVAEVQAIGPKQSFLWSANNSVAVDAEFWSLVKSASEKIHVGAVNERMHDLGFLPELERKAHTVWRAVIDAQYGDRTGEPGFLNVDRLDNNTEGLENYLAMPFIKGSSPDYTEIQRAIAEKVLVHPYKFIVNPCLPAETIINTSEGPKPIKDLIGKPFTVVFQGEQYKCSGFWKTGRKAAWRIATNKGPVTATPEHRFWVCKPDGYDDWFSVDEIKHGDYIITDSGEKARVLRKRPVRTKVDVYDCEVETVHAFIADGFQTHNCGEIVLSIMSGVCVIGDVVPFFAKDDADVEESMRLTVRALMRANLMDQIYGEEIKRTNRIGVSLTGVHEWAWKRFGFGFRDLIDETKSKAFWDRLATLAEIVRVEADKYAGVLGVTAPHTLRTIKPAGTTSKLFGLTEGAHLPAMREYLRWVQFRSDDPLVKKYDKKGYPTKELKSYAGTTIIGFPTRPLICALGMGDALITADEATPQEQFQWVRLLEKYWIGESRGNQISYTLKYKPEDITIEDYELVMLRNVPTVRAISVLPTALKMSYEYMPEQSITAKKYDSLMEDIGRRMHEDVDVVHVQCDGNGCPIDFHKDKLAA